MFWQPVNSRATGFQNVSHYLNNSPSEEYAHPWPDDHVFKCIILFFFSQSYIEQGLFTFTYGQGDSVVDFVHVNNLVQAHVLAGEALHASKNAIAVSIWHSEKLCSHRITSKTTQFPLGPGPPSIRPPTHNIGGWIITWLVLKLLIVVKGWVSSWKDYRRITFEALLLTTLVIIDHL